MEVTAMIELVEKAMMVGMGALSLSQKKAEELLQDLKSRCNVSEEEGKALLERMQQFADENQKKFTAMAQEEVKKAYERMGLIEREEFEKLRKKVTLLEKRLKDAGK